jgi:hypothetical protein
VPGAADSAIAVNAFIAKIDPLEYFRQEHGLVENVQSSGGY